MKVSKTELSLELDCWVDELSPAQLAAYEKAEKEHNAIKDKLKNLMSSNEGRELFSGDLFSAYTFKGNVLQEYTNYLPKKTIPQKPLDRSQRSSKKRAAFNLVYIESDDDEDIPLAKRTFTASAKSRGRNVQEKTPATPKPSPKVLPKLSPPTKTSGPKAKVPPKQANKVTTEKAPPPNFRPSEVSSVGGLTVGSDSKDGSKAGDSKEVKLQGKTFPSLVVLAKPSLKVKDMSATRSKLDSKVKVVLMLTPNKFTEWLIQEGMLKSEQKCTNHRNNELKLGVYSDASKFPYSGGYVWISECCPTRFVSVFHGSLFEGAPHPPSCILKLIYHWSCQTNIQNVVQWVKVDNVYIKGVYTWLRAACTLAIHQKFKPLGGAGKYVEVGVISLGTTSQDGQQRQVKVEVLGVYDYLDKTIRLRAIEPVSDADRNYKKRFQTILEPLGRWVSKDSIIAIDLTVDKMTLYQMGFKNIVQAAATDSTAKHTNSAVMDYLRRIVPRMFQNTLSLLSRQMIQQFLDELVWREQFGTYALQAFNNITSHIAEQTRMNTVETLTQRLYQVATNPFKDWSVVNLAAHDNITATTTPKRLKKPINDADYTPPTKTIKQEKVKIKKPEEIKQEKGKNVKSLPIPASSTKKQELKPKQEELKGLEEIYYGIKDGLDENFEIMISDFKAQCPKCTEQLESNDNLQKHIFSHICIDGKEYLHQCLYCLEKHSSESNLKRHLQIMHPTETKTPSSSSYYCIICQNRFNNLHVLTMHLQKIHNSLELPYCCVACGYKSSSHRDVVRHFYDDHKNQNFLQCPFCLHIFKVYIKGRKSSENINLFYGHLQQHLSKADNKRCTKCVLLFHQRGLLKMHQMFDHQSMVKDLSVRRLMESSILIDIPRSKNVPKESLPYTNQLKFDKLILCMEAGKLCAECEDEIAYSEHFTGVLKCNKCLYKTCCQRAMFKHTAVCQSNGTCPSSFDTRLDVEMHCVCGFLSFDGNTMARHLATSGHKTAYPSVEAAQENTVKRNMLDMLGLVRRDDSGENATNTEKLDESLFPPTDEKTEQAAKDVQNVPDESSNDLIETAVEEKSEEHIHENTGPGPDMPVISDLLGVATEILDPHS